MTVSMVSRCHDTETHPISFDEIWRVTRSGDHGLKEKITQIRNRYEVEKDITGSVEKAKKAIAELKLNLPGFLPSGSFKERQNSALVEHSGLLCADLDSLGEKLPMVRETLKSYPVVHAIALSPSGDGLKVFFNVSNDSTRHEDSFRAIKQFMVDEAGLAIDEKCKDPARICFFTYDPDLWLRTEGNEAIPPAPPISRPRPILAENVADLPQRERIAYLLLGELTPAPDKGGFFCRCPGEYHHSNKSAEKHTIVYLESVPTLHCQHQSCAGAVDAFNRVLRSEIGKAESAIVARRTFPYRDMRNATILDNGNKENALTPEKQLFRLHSINDYENYVPPVGIELIGDFHIVKDAGFVFAVGGPPGVGKSLCSISLAMAGARGEGEWFGMKVHRKFKTAILQTENGMFRLSRNVKSIDCPELRDWVAICEPPPYGMIFRNSDFRKQVTEQLEAFQPDVVIIDPWNSVARDQEQKTYLESFEIIRSVLPVDTALGIIAHTRKPSKDERSIGRSLMNVLAGSHVLVSVPRSVFVLQYASDDVEDDQVVWTCCKNNDGDLGKRTAWKRKVGMFEPVPNFDWATFDATDRDKRVVITDEMVEEVFDDGPLLLTMARDKLHELSGASKSQCYRVLSPKGRLCDNLVFNGKTVNWLRK